MKIDVIGVGSAFSTQCNTSSVRVIDNEGHQCLIDCGPTVPRAIWQRNISIEAIGALYFTHIHPDHCTGLTALLNRWDSDKRQNPLDIFAQKAHIEHLQGLAELAHWPVKSLGYKVNWLPIEDEFHWRSWRIRTAKTKHSMSNRALCIDADGARFFYSGDGRPTPASTALMSGAQVAFQECVGAEPLDPREGHGDLPNTLTLRQQVDFGTLYLYHCDDAARPEMAQQLCHQEHIQLAEDGLQITL